MPIHAEYEIQQFFPSDTHEAVFYQQEENGFTLPREDLIGISLCKVTRYSKGKILNEGLELVGVSLRPFGGFTIVDGDPKLVAIVAKGEPIFPDHPNIPLPVKRLGFVSHGGEKKI